MKTMENLKFPVGQFIKPETISESEIKNWISKIESFPNRLQTLVNSLSKEQLNWVYRPNGWTIKQVVHHCADSHMNSFIRFKLAITEEFPEIKPYEEQLWAELSDGICDDISPSISIIKGVHKRWVLLLNTFTSTELQKGFYHPGSQKIILLDEAIRLYAWHANHHLAHIAQALKFKNNFNTYIYE